jgi:Tol biopolymer transport system component
MKKVPIKFYSIVIVLCVLNQIIAQKEIVSPIDDLPPYITPLTSFGQRADWSHDGKRILFIEKTFGDVYEIELKTKRLRPMTHHYFHEGYTRALYLSSGDILLSGARQFNADDPWPSRSENNAELWILKQDLSRPPIPLGEKCSEGPTVSRTHMRIAWTQKNKIHVGSIVTEDGTPRIVRKRVILDAAELDFTCHLETQNFRPPEEKEIIFSAYDYQGGEVMGVMIETGKVMNYSNAKNQYDEPEGIFPDGKHTLVESDRHASKGKEFKGIQYIDIHKLALDGSGKYERITRFNDYAGWKATNPVVSDDGRFIAFQCAKYGDPAGVGRGILLFDVKMYEKMRKVKNTVRP